MKLLQPLRRWPTVEAFVQRVTGHFTAWPADDFGRFVSPSAGIGMGGALIAVPAYGEPLRAPRAAEPPPGTVEMRFMQLHLEGRFEDMWDLLAEDAQHAWGGLHNFIREMPRLEQWLEILEMHVTNVTLLETWTDHIHQRTYNNVARLVMHYRVRQQWREWSFDRQVHLVPGAGGWRTLCYPMRVRTATGR